MKKFGRYDIVEELGRGAMGVVYKAADPTIGRLVALKVLSLDASPEPGVPGPQEIFMREARAAGRLAHPAIVTIHDAFEDADTKSSCIVMELVHGQTLEKLLLSGAQFAVEQTLEIVRQVADALDYAHRQQVIHRDLKPANILLSEDGRAKLTDFGIAKIIAREGALRTAALLGTPSYMSPEQVKGKDIDARSDLFSLGIILYRMLTGQKPFAGDTAAVMFKIAFEDAVPPSKLNPQLTPEQDYLVLRLLAKDRDKRYQSARQFLDDLDDVRNGRPPRSEGVVPASELPVGEPTIMADRIPMVPPPAEAAPPPRKIARWASVAVVVTASGVALVILGSMLGSGVWKFRPAKAPPPTDLKSEISNLKSQTPSAASAASHPPSGSATSHSPAAPMASQPSAPSKVSQPPAVSLASRPSAPSQSVSMPPVGTAKRPSSPGPAGKQTFSAQLTNEGGKGAPGGKELLSKASGKPKPVTRGANSGRAVSAQTPGPAAGQTEAKLPADLAAATPPTQSVGPPAAQPASTSAANLASPSATAPSNTAAAASRILIRCRYELKEGTLSVSNGAKEIFQADLKGRKKGGLRRITGGGYEGLFTDAFNVPPGTRELMVRVSSPPAGINFSKPIAFTLPQGSSAVLEVVVKHDEIQLSWRPPASSTP